MQCAILQATTTAVAGQATDPADPGALLGVELRLAGSASTSSVMTATASSSGSNLPGLTASGHAFQFDLAPAFASAGDRVIVTATAADGRRTSTSPVALTTPPVSIATAPPTSDTASTDVSRRGLLVMNDQIASDPLNMADIPVQAVSIFTVRADGTDRKRLTGPGNQYPSWTPDGKIIFVSDRTGSPQIWIMDEDGKNARQLGHVHNRRITRVQMARNGLIAFLQPGDGIWLMHEDGSELRELVKFRHGGDCPSLALSGSWLTFTLPAESTPGHNEIFRIQADGSGLKQLTFPTDADYPDANASAISPDETTIAIYTGVESKPGQTLATMGHRNIALIGANGGPRSLLTHCRPAKTPQELAQMTRCEDCVTSDNPTWSPDGRWIVYDRGSPLECGSGTWAIDVHGDAMHQLSPDFAGGGSIPLKLEVRP